MVGSQFVLWPTGTPHHEVFLNPRYELCIWKRLHSHRLYFGIRISAFNIQRLALLGFNILGDAPRLGSSGFWVAVGGLGLLSVALHCSGLLDCSRLLWSAL